MPDVRIRISDPFLLTYLFIQHSFSVHTIEKSENPLDGSEHQT